MNAGHIEKTDWLSKVVNFWGQSLIGPGNITLLRVLLYGIFALEALSFFDAEVLQYYVIGNVSLTIVDWLHFPHLIKGILWLRLLSALCVAFGFFPNFFKYIACAATLLAYNQNILFYNNHFYLEAWLSAMALIPTYRANQWVFNNDEKQIEQINKKNEIKAAVFWFLLKSLICIVYFYTFLVKPRLVHIYPIQYLGMIADLGLLGLCLLHHKKWARNLLIVSGLGFHLGTAFFFKIGVFPYLMSSLLICTFLAIPSGKDSWAWLKGQLMGRQKY